MKTKYFTTFFLVLSSMLHFSINAQVPEIQWQQCFGTINNDHVYSIAPTNQGYLIGITVSDGDGLTNNHGSNEAWIINLDTFGNILWEKCFGGSQGDGVQKIIQVSVNSFFLYGGTSSSDGDVQSNPEGESDIWIVKINESGDIIWENCYGSEGPEELRDFILTPDGGSLILSRIHAPGGDVSQYYGSWDVWLCKIDSVGNIEWEKTLGNQYLDNAGTLQINSQGNIYVLAASVLSGGMVSCGLNNIDRYDIWLVELNMQGEILNQYCYGGSYNDFGFVFEELDDGLIFAGITNSNDYDVSGYHGTPGALGYADIWVVRLDENMNIVWQKCLGGSEIEYPAYISQTEDGSFILLGHTSSHNYDVSGNHSAPNGYDSDVWVVKLSSDGELLWQKCYGGLGDEGLFLPYTVLQKSDYNFVLASWTDYVSDDVTCNIHQTYIQDAWIFELDIEDTTNMIEFGSKNCAIIVYPNPTKDYLVFEIPNVKENFQNIIITNTLGQYVASFDVTGGKTIWDTRQIKEGIYIYSFYSESSIKSGKIVIK